MAEALGVDVRRVYSVVFTLGAVLGTVAGALVVPTAAASLDMAIEFVIEAFAVVVIGGLGSMRGALAGALIVGLIRALSIVLYPELEVLAIYVIVIARAAVPSRRPVREAGDMRSRRRCRGDRRHRALALLPLVAPPYYVSLMIPFFGYAIALLGFNLLFGYTGLLSFGHAMFLGFGAYGAAVCRASAASFELVLLVVMVGGDAVALPIGALCVRYVGIFFGMLTLAFGMLFHSFLFKFYHLTGGDSGMRVPRMNILGLDFASYNKIELLAGPFYYYCLGAHDRRRPRDVADRALAVRAAPAGDPRQCPQGRISRRARASLPLAAFVISAGFGAAGGAILGFRIGLADPELVYWTHPASSCSWPCLAASRISSGRSSARWPSRCCRTSCNR